jgi:4-amino-4-deoxy-L-arabinose transferase-like glycosyltransferase
VTGHGLSTYRFALSLFVLVGASRALTSGPAYFADAQAHIEAIRTRTYVIHTPGYWLFNRVAGLFPDPETAIAVMNWLFSAAGSVVLYLALRRLASESVARLAAMAYASVFFGWFSGNVHSTYASQLLFPVAVFLCLLHYWDSAGIGWLLGAGVLFALGAGFRPSDGVFFAPAVGYALSRCPRRHALVCAAVTVAVCLAWLLPQQIALARAAAHIELSNAAQLGHVANGIVVSGLTVYAASNALRFILPLGLALLPVLPLVVGPRKLGRQTVTFLWLWILPGSAFFALVYISDPPYLNVLLAPLLILAAVSAKATDRRKIALLVLCVALNVTFYFGWRPMTFAAQALQRVEYVVDVDLGKCSFYAVHHRYWPRLKDFL